MGLWAALRQHRVGSCQPGFEVAADGCEEVGGVDGAGGEAFHEVHQVLRHRALVERVEAGGFEFLTEAYEVGQAVQLAALLQRTAPGEDGGDGVR